jgi:hypothetical protein
MIRKACDFVGPSRRRRPPCRTELAPAQCRTYSLINALRLSVCWSIACVFSLLLALEADGQSGRRAPRPAATTNPTTELPVAPSSSSPELARKVTVLVGRQPTSRHLLSEDSIYASFVQRLSEYSSITATPIGDLKREKAVKRAQTEPEAFVVLLQFDIDSYQEGTILLNSQDLVVKYTVFAPGTGKQQSKGKVYYQTVGGGRLRKSEWPTGTPIKITTEAAGIEAAEQFYSWLAVIVGIKHKD